MPALFQPTLKPGGRVAIISPARHASPEKYQNFCALLTSRGYELFVHPQNDLSYGQLAGSDENRVAALHAVFADPSIDAVFCARGGTGATRLVQMIDYELIKAHPKVFVGSSDITSLLLTISNKCGFSTFHGPMGISYADKFLDTRTTEDFFALIEGRVGPKANTHQMVYEGVDVVVAGQAKGTLIGGNISLMQYLVGTPYQWETSGLSGCGMDDPILFLEDVDEALYKIDMKLCHFAMAGIFKNAKAVLIGEMVDVTDGETGFNRPGEKPYGYDLKQIVQRYVPPHIPLVFNVPCGHGHYLTTFPEGACVELKAEGHKFEINYI